MKTTPHAPSTLLVVAAAAALLTAASPAAAVATASGTISSVSWTLIDLDLGDGITPMVTFTDQSSSVYAQAGTGSSLWVPDLTTPLSVSDASAGRSAWAWTDGLGSGSAGASSQNLMSAYAYAYPFSANFTLTPWTAIVWTASFSGTANTTIGHDGTNSEYASAYAYLQTSISQADGGESHYAYRRAYASYEWDGIQYIGQSMSFDGSFSTSFANLTGASVSGWTYAYASASAVGLPPIPEPTTTALMLAGLASVGFIAARRRRRESRPG